MNALLLAAGEGTRLRPLTEKLPKPMIPIAGKPILQHNIELLARHGIREIAINLHHCPEVVRSHFGDGSRFGVSITYSYEPELLGTAGAVKKLGTSFFQDTFLVIYGDNRIECDLHRLLAFHQARAGIATLALHYREHVTHSGVVALDGSDRVLQFVEKPRANQIPSHWVNAGVLVLEPRVLDHIPAGVPSDFGKDILPHLLEQGERLYGYRLTGDEGIRWIDTPADLERVRQMAEGGMRRLKKAREKA
ncbi:MAG: nucleotidyltransferase family protein [Chloroflexi bacterium]|nr:nucleotidyltransferase family protein [Chloroflexota bacterium]